MEALKISDEKQPIQFPTPLPKTGELIRKVFWLKLLVGLLFLSNLFIGGIAIWAARSSDNAYSSLLESKLPLLEKLGNIGVDYSRLQRRHLNLFLVAPKDEDTVRSDCQVLFAQATKSLKEVHEMLGEAGLAIESAELNQFSDSYLKTLRQFDQIMSEGKKNEASDFARLTLRPTLEALLRRVDQLDSQVRGDVLRQSELISKSNKVLNRLMFGLAGWPLFLSALAFVFFVAVIIWLVFLSQRLGLDDRD